MTRRWLAPFAIVSAVLLASAAHAAVFPRSAPPGQCQTVHGRMKLYNGTFSFRIWVIGTHRILRIVDDGGDNLGDPDLLPSSLKHRLQPYEHDLFRPDVFGDFRVCAYTRSQPGVMQSVTLRSARNILIQD